MVELRPYQEEAVATLRANAPTDKHQLLYLPTGAGKTVVASHFLHNCWSRKRRGVFMADRISLIDQTSATLDRYGIPHGVIQGNHWRARGYEYIQVASPQTVARRGWPEQVDLLVVDECFVAGTKVMTPDGGVAIESVRPGDAVLTAVGRGIVRGTVAAPIGRRDMVRVAFEDGHETVCTGSHPFFTDGGWVAARELAGHRVARVEDLPAMWRALQAAVQAKPQGNSSGGIKSGVGRARDLLQKLCQEIEKPNALSRSSSEDVDDVEEDWAQAKGAWWEWESSLRSSATAVADSWGRLERRIHCPDRAEEGGRASVALQDRLGESINDGGDRGRRGESLFDEGSGGGREEDGLSWFQRVVSVSREECGSDAVVYNLHVSGHPSYFADGRLVHNCHTTFKATAEFMREHPDVFVVGLTATPFTKGLGDLFSKVVSCTTTDQLVEEGHLAPIRPYLAVAADMRGAKVSSTGEWTEAALTERGMAIVGDVVAEWVAKTQEHFGGPVPSIVFGATVDHCIELARQFQAAGHNFQVVSYRNKDEENAQLIADFKAPGSDIVGLISCVALGKGFDATHILCGVDAHPYRKSFSSHIQQLGRVMRPHEGKEYALWLDHSGNFARFFDDTIDLFAHGVQELSGESLDAKERKEPTEEEREMFACPSCHYALGGAKVCPSCGWERPARLSMVENVAGTMVELDIGQRKNKHAWQENKFYAWKEIAAVALDWKRGDVSSAERFAKAQYHSIYGDWPPRDYSMAHAAAHPDPAIYSYIKSAVIRWARGKARRAA